MRRLAFALLLALSVPALGCTAKKPPRWAEGGMTLALGRARWDRGDQVVDLLPDGRILVDGEHTMTIDAAGRVFTPGREPIAVLQPTSRLRGNDDADMGEVGVVSASPKGSTYAWVIINPDGSVTTFDEEGRPRPSGGWNGCSGPVLRTCTLVSHLLVERQAARSSGPRFGFGIGVIVPVR